MCNFVHPETTRQVETVPVKDNGYAYKLFGKTADGQLVTPFDRYGQCIYNHEDNRIEWDHEFFNTHRKAGFALFRTKKAADYAWRELSMYRPYIKWNLNPHAKSFVIRKVRYNGALICRNEVGNEVWAALGPVFLIAKAFTPKLEEGEWL